MRPPIIFLVILTACIVGASFGDSCQFRNSAVSGVDAGAASNGQHTRTQGSYEATLQDEYIIKLEKEKGE